LAEYARKQQQQQQQEQQEQHHDEEHSPSLSLPSPSGYAAFTQHLKVHGRN